MSDDGRSRRPRRALTGAAVAAFATGCLIACSGGSGSTSITPPEPTAQALLSVVTSVSTSSSFLTAGVRSIVITAAPLAGSTFPAVPPSIIDVGPGASDCAASGSVTICTGKTQTVAGVQNFQVATYTGPGGAGTETSVESLTVTISRAGQVVDFSGASGKIGVVSSVDLVLTPASVGIGNATTIVVSAVPRDAAGNAIVGPFDQSISIVAPTPGPNLPPFLMFPNSNGSVGSGPNSGSLLYLITAPGQTLSYQYNGTRVVPTTAVFQAQFGASTSTATLNFVKPTPRPTPTLAPGQTPPTPTPTPTPIPTPTIMPTAPPLPPTPTPGTVTVVPNQLVFLAPSAPAQTFVASEANHAAFSATSSNGAVATVAAVVGSTTMFAVTPVGQGATTIAVSDGAGGNATVNVLVNQTGIIVQGKRFR